MLKFEKPSSTKPGPGRPTKAKTTPKSQIPPRNTPPSPSPPPPIKPIKLKKMPERRSERQLAPLRSKRSGTHISPIILRGGSTNPPRSLVPGSLVPHFATKIRGPVKQAVLQYIVDGTAWAEMRRLLKSRFHVEVVADTLQAFARKHTNLLKHIAERQIGLALNRGLANKGTRISALIQHFDDLNEMISQHRSGTRFLKKKWEILPSLTNLLQERRRTLEAIKGEVEPFKVNIHAGRIEHVYREEAAKAVEELRDHADELPQDLRDVLAEALRKDASRHEAEIRGDAKSDGVPEFHADTAPNPWED